MTADDKVGLGAGALALGLAGGVILLDAGLPNGIFGFHREVVTAEAIFDGIVFALGVPTGIYLFYKARGRRSRSDGASPRGSCGPLAAMISAWACMPFSRICTMHAGGRSERSAQRASRSRLLNFRSRLGSAWRGTFGTRRVAVFATASPHFAPGGLVVLAAAAAAATAIGLARPAVQAATGHQIRVGRVDS